MAELGDEDDEGVDEEEEMANYKSVSPNKHNDEDITKQITIIESKL